MISFKELIESSIEIFAENFYSPQKLTNILKKLNFKAKGFYFKLYSIWGINSVIGYLVSWFVNISKINNKNTINWNYMCIIYSICWFSFTGKCFFRWHLFIYLGINMIYIILKLIKYLFLSNFIMAIQRNYN